MNSDPSATPSLDLASVNALMVSHIDNAGVGRVKVIPRDRIASVLSKGATLSLSVGMLLAIDDHPESTDAIDPTIGDLRGIPDVTALAMIDPDRGLAWAPSNLYGMDGKPHPTCQRSALERVGSDAHAAGYEFLVGMELEFTLFAGPKDAPVVAHSGPGYGTRTFLELEAWSLDLLDALRIAGVPVEQLHPEYSAGQMELSFAPRSPVRAVDDYILARMIITRVSLKHGFNASFAPVAHVDGLANGCHIHLSASRDGRNIFYDETTATGFTVDAGQMIAGVLEHLSDGLVLLGGSTLSFERLQPHNWAGAFACWGASNREAAIRYMGGFGGFGAQQSNIEVKCADPSANLYLATAALIGSALDGVRQQRELPEGVNVEPGLLTVEERERAHATRFPENLGAALDLFEKSAFFEQLLGPMSFHSYIAVRRHDWNTFGEMDPAEVAEMVRWRY